MTVATGSGRGIAGALAFLAVNEIANGLSSAFVEMYERRSLHYRLRRLSTNLV